MVVCRSHWCVAIGGCWRARAPVTAEEDEEEGDEDHPVTIGHSNEHPDIAERKLFCRVLASEEIKRLKEPTLQENQRVRAIVTCGIQHTIVPR